MIVTGTEDLSRQFESLRRGAGRIARRAVARAAESAADGIRSRISNPSVRGTIGARLSKSRGEVAEAKIGAGVGKRAATSVQNRTGRPGVGISARNVHWWFLGTKDRYTGTKRSRTGRKDTGKRKRFTGKMPPQDRPISVLFNANGTVRVLETWVAVGIKEAIGE
jgi:hypothetical protein